MYSDRSSSYDDHVCNKCMHPTEKLSSSYFLDAMHQQRVNVRRRGASLILCSLSIALVLLLYMFIPLWIWFTIRRRFSRCCNKVAFEYTLG